MLLNIFCILSGVFHSRQWQFRAVCVELYARTIYFPYHFSRSEMSYIYSIPFMQSLFFYLKFMGSLDCSILWQSVWLHLVYDWEKKRHIICWFFICCAKLPCFCIALYFWNRLYTIILYIIRLCNINANFPKQSIHTSMFNVSHT